MLRVANGHCSDPRCFLILISALQDNDHSAAWMAARGLVPSGRACIEPILHMLSRAQMTPWLRETVSYMLHTQCLHDSELASTLNPCCRKCTAPPTKVAAHISHSGLWNSLQHPACSGNLGTRSSAHQQTPGLYTGHALRPGCLFQRDESQGVPVRGLAHFSCQDA
jgi:hypothetical protein